MKTGSLSRYNFSKIAFLFFHHWDHFVSVLGLSGSKTEEGNLKNLSDGDTCPKCGFTISVTILPVQDGAISGCIPELSRMEAVNELTFLPQLKRIECNNTKCALHEGKEIHV